MVLAVADDEGVVGALAGDDGLRGAAAGLQHLVTRAATPFARNSFQIAAAANTFARKSFQIAAIPFARKRFQHATPDVYGTRRTIIT